MKTAPADCREALELLHEYLKEDLTPANQERVASHLAACRHCLEHSQFERNFLAALDRAARGARCPDALAARIREALRDDPRA